VKSNEMAFLIAIRGERFKVLGAIHELPLRILNFLNLCEGFSHKKGTK
jgi:hypothetical protein